jgi:hypothetical protein
VTVRSNSRNSVPELVWSVVTNRGWWIGIAWIPELVGTDSWNWRNWSKLIPEAEQVLQCSTSWNRMYSHLRQVGDLKKSHRCPFKGDYTVYIDCISVNWFIVIWSMLLQHYISYYSEFYFHLPIFVGSNDNVYILLHNKPND